MTTLRDLIPDPGIVADTHPGDLAGYVLEVLLSSAGSTGLWHRRNFCGDAGRSYVQRGEGSHPGVMQACSEAWSWLESNGLICPDADKGDAWYGPTRRARDVRDRRGVRALIANQELPEHFLHPEIVLHARSLFLQGRLDTAVFEAFKTLEVEIRTAAKLGNELVGVKLAGVAFHPDIGALRDQEAEAGEREALRNLVVGAIGYCKNPSSHRRVALSTDDARALLVLASYLLRIVDDRRPKAGEPQLIGLD